MTTEETKALLRHTEEEVIPTDEDSILGKIESGQADTLGKQLLDITDLDGVERVGMEEVADLTNGALTTEGLEGVRRIGLEVESNISGNIGTDCKENPDDDVTVGSTQRNEDLGMKIESGRDEEPTDVVVSFRNK